MCFSLVTPSLRAPRIGGRKGGQAVMRALSANFECLSDTDLAAGLYSMRKEYKKTAAQMMSGAYGGYGC